MQKKLRFAMMEIISFSVEELKKEKQKRKHLKENY